MGFLGSGIHHLGNLSSISEVDFFLPVTKELLWAHGAQGAAVRNAHRCVTHFTSPGQQEMSLSLRAGRVSNTPGVKTSSLNPHPRLPAPPGRVSQTHRTGLRWWITGAVGASCQWWQRGVSFRGTCKKKKRKNHAENACGENIPAASCESLSAAPESSEQEARSSGLHFAICVMSGKREIDSDCLTEKKNNIKSLFCLSQSCFYLCFSGCRSRCSALEKRAVQSPAYHTIPHNRETGAVIKPWAVCRAFSTG